MDEGNPLPDRSVSTPVVVQQESRKNKRIESIYYMSFLCYHYYVQRESQNMYYRRLRWILSSKLTVNIFITMLDNVTKSVLCGLFLSVPDGIAYLRRHCIFIYYVSPP